MSFISMVSNQLSPRPVVRISICHLYCMYRWDEMIEPCLCLLICPAGPKAPLLEGSNLSYGDPLKLHHWHNLLWSEMFTYFQHMGGIYFLWGEYTYYSQPLHAPTVYSEQPPLLTDDDLNTLSLFFLAMMAASGCQTSIKAPMWFSSMKRNNWLAHALDQHLGQYPFATKKLTLGSQNIKQYHRFSDSTVVTIWLKVFGGSGIAQWQVSCRQMLDHLDSCWPHCVFGPPNSSNCLQWRKHMNPL